MEVKVERWKSERAWFALVLVISLVLWGLLTISVVGLVYALMIALFFVISHIAFIAHIRGSAVRISETQFPELHERIRQLSQAAGLAKAPEAYIMQAGGSLNALATKLFGSKFIILYSDLLEACGDNDAARDMIIGHELGHIKAGHLRMLWLLLPGLFFPFVGSAYSRAREFTCDRYGAALCGDQKAALQGLAILSAGAQYGPKVNMEAFMAQRHDLNSGLMTIGKWFGSHPPLSERVAALEPAAASVSLTKGHLRAALVLFILFVMPAVAAAVGWNSFKGMLDEAADFDGGYQMQLSAEEAQLKVVSDLDLLVALVAEIQAQSGQLPDDENETLSALWRTHRAEMAEPLDPFDGQPYGYYLVEGGYVIWSIGPDGEVYTDDDIIYDSTKVE